MAAPEPEFHIELTEVAQFLGDRKALSLARVLDWVKLVADGSSFVCPSFATHLVGLRRSLTRNGVSLRPSLPWV